MVAGLENIGVGQPGKGRVMGRSGLISESMTRVGRNKRYVLWFYVMNLGFAFVGAEAFSTHVHGILDHSLYADKLLHGFDVAVLTEMLSRPEFGPLRNSALPSFMVVGLFVLVSIVLMPGVLLGYSSDHRISTEEFYRACGRNLWRFVRLLVFFLIVGAIVGIGLATAQDAIAKAVGKNAIDERLPFAVQMLCVGIIFVVMTAIRIWFDLAQTDAVLSDQPAVRRCLSLAWRLAGRNLWSLLGSYVGIAIIAGAILVAGIVIWHATVPPSSVLGAFLVSQITLVLLLAMRFWQRAAAVEFYLRHWRESSVEQHSPMATVAL
jgi:hypothetical protein